MLLRQQSACRTLRILHSQLQHQLRSYAKTPTKMTNVDKTKLEHKFGPQIDNYYAGSPLNRLAFLRPNSKFLSEALIHPSANFILFKDLDALAESATRLKFVKYDDIKSFLGNPFEKDEKERLETYDSDKEIPIVVFLGVDERVKDPFVFETYKGQPYFSVDITPRGDKKEEAEKLVKEITNKYQGSEFKKTRLDLKLEPEHASILAPARSLTDWNNRNRFCATCGQSTISTNAGAKRSCPAKDKGKERAPCITREGVHNVAFPRTDPTVIMAILNSDSSKILLGRQKRWPAHFYSCLAGFLEPGESVEEAVRRETWEESGVTVGRVVLHSTQPWPYPANLMIGCVGQATPDGEQIYLKHDPELETAKWFTFEEVRAAVKLATTSLTDPPPANYKEGDLRLPPGTAIAHQLISAVVDTGFHLAKF